MRFNKYFLISSAILFSSPALAVEYPIGKPQTCGNMEIAAVYLQPIEMEPEGIMLPAVKSDVHLEADIHATANNKNGFQEGSWVPYIQVAYEISKSGESKNV